ncbi:MAG: hypothetical protein KJN85_07560 [Maribacter sp.]|nr:hypothetical protein [Maribacter sp.]
MKKILSIVCCFIICICSSAQSVSNIPGEVTEVRDKEVIIDYTGELIPNVGDPVSIGFEVDGDFVPYDVTWIVMEVSGGGVSALNMNFENPRQLLGYKAMIKSKNPRRPTYYDVIQPGWPGNIIGIVPMVGAQVDKLLFFKSEKGLPKVDQRKYTKYFSASETQYINWHLNLRRSPPGKRIDFKIIAKYFKSDGKEIAEYNKDSYFDADWSSSYHSSGWGSTNTGFWKIGKYYVQLYVNDQLIAQEPFFVY